jgi:hypothetical protein
MRSSGVEMSLDFPLFEEMRRRGSRGALWWRLGDCLYYLGLLPAYALIVAALLVYGVARYFTIPIRVCWVMGIAWMCFVAVFFVGASLKGYSYRLAERGGIDPTKY